MKKIILIGTDDVSEDVLQQQGNRIVNVTGTKVDGVESYNKLTLDLVKTRQMNSEEITQFYIKQLGSLNPNKIKKSLLDKNRVTSVLCTREQFQPLMSFLNIN